MSEWKPTLPEFKVNKSRSGYEIRTDILNLAKDIAMSEWKAKYAEWEFSIKKDEAAGKVITEINMPPFPGLDTILSTAERLYSFVNSSKEK